MEKPLTSIVIGSFNRKLFLQKAIDSIRNSETDYTFEIIVVDGGSSDGSINWLIQQKDIITIVQHNRDEEKKDFMQRSWGYFMNLGFKAAQGKYICMLSDDCLVHPDTISKGMDFFEKKLELGENVGAVPFYWRNWPEEKEQYKVGTILGGNYNVNHGMYIKEALEKVGYIDEERYQFYYADGDLCLKMVEAGYSIIPCKEAFVEHHSHANIKVKTSNFQKEKEDKKSYLDRWQSTYDINNRAIGSAEFIEAPTYIDMNIAERSWGGINLKKRVLNFFKPKSCV